jgi:hypothetical protein
MKPKQKNGTDTPKRPVENTLRRIWLYRGRWPHTYKDESSMAVTCAMLKMADPCLKETLKMNKEVYFQE